MKHAYNLKEWRISVAIFWPITVKESGSLLSKHPAAAYVHQRNPMPCDKLEMSDHAFSFRECLQLSAVRIDVAEDILDISDFEAWTWPLERLMCFKSNTFLKVLFKPSRWRWSTGVIGQNAGGYLCHILAQSDCYIKENGPRRQSEANGTHSLTEIEILF